MPKDSPTPQPPGTRKAKREERRAAAIQAEQRQKRLRILGSIAVAAIAIAAMLIWVNRPSDDSASLDIDYASIPQDGHVLGNPDAPVTLVEYADYQCPACGQFARESLPQVIRDYVESGQVKVEFRVYPFLGGQDLNDPNNESVNAAMAAECARDQGKFWEYNHALFESQNGENKGGFSIENLQNVADDVGLDRTQFDACLESGEHRADVIASYDEAVAAGVNSTPTLILNGVTVAYTTSGYERLQEQIDAAIAGEVIPT